MTTAFVVGNTYYGSLAVAHSAFPVVCVRRTEKSAWFEHANSEAYKPARAKAHKWTDGSESANFHNWYISSDSIKDNGWDTKIETYQLMFPTPITRVCSNPSTPTTRLAAG